MKKSISEIITQLSRIEKDEDQVEWLRKHDTVTLRIILKFWYDERIKFLVPDTTPPYKPLAHNNHGILYGKARILPLFVEGGTNPDMNKYMRENKFIQLLEQVHADDAVILCKMISKKPLPYLTKSVIAEAFPELFQ